MTSETKYVGYYRASTKHKQINSIEVQRSAIERHLQTYGGKIVAEFQERESGSKNDRKELKKALALCKREGYTLLVAKVDRLTRSFLFLSMLLESKVPFICCDNPFIDEMSIKILAAVAERERQNTITRIRETNTYKRARGEKVGMPENLNEASKIVGRKIGVASIKENANNFADELYGKIIRKRKEGYTLKGIAECLNNQGEKTARGGKFYATTIKNILDRIEKQ